MIDHRMIYLGILPIVFAGDFCQLKPVGGHSLLSMKTFLLWRNKFNTFLELKTNHGFHTDPEWGKLLKHWRSNGPTEEQVDIINNTIVGPSDELPENIAYAMYNNKGKCAIIDGIFAEFIKSTHFQNICDNLPSHTIVVKASSLKLKSS